MNKILLVLGLLLIIFYFSLNRKEWIPLEYMALDDNNVPFDSNQLYFPKKSFNDFLKPWIGLRHNELFSSELFKMKEPILFNDRVKKETYRLMWLRSFNDPVVVRIEKNNEDYMLYWKIRCDSCETNRLTLSKSRIISKSEWNSFKWQLQKTFYWRMWSKIPSLAIGLDGSEWILEGSNKNNYHVVERWSPDNTNYRKCCTYLLQMTDIKKIK